MASLPVQILKTVKYNRFYQDFNNGNSAALKYLPAFNQQKLTELTDQLLPMSDVQQQVKKILSEQNRYTSSPAAQKYLKALADPNSLIIITGQQLGLMVSPLYTVYKALTILKLAELLNKDNLKYIPVFWLETEDHDFQEINHLGIWDGKLNPVQIRYDGQDAGRKSIRHYIIGDKIAEVFSALEDRLIDTEFKTDFMNSLREFYQPGTSWVDAACSFFRQLFASTGLLFFEPGREEIKNISASFFIDFVEKAADVTDIIQKTSRNLADSGYDLQVNPLPGKTYVHIEDENQQRLHLYFEQNEFYFKDRTDRYSKAQIQGLIKSAPDRVSTAVISRPLLQSWLLPVAVYVAGPAEIAYWAQLGDLFSKFNIMLPLIAPRSSATLIEPKVKRFTEKHDIDLGILPLKKQNFIDTYFSHMPEDAIRNPIVSIREMLREIREDLTVYLNQLDPTLVPVGEKTLERIIGQIDNLEGRSVQARQRNEVTVTSHLAQIHEAVFPEGTPQERYISPVYFINKFGDNFISELFKKLEILNSGHQLIEVG